MFNVHVSVATDVQRLAWRQGQGGSQRSSRDLLPRGGVDVRRSRGDALRECDGLSRRLRCLGDFSLRCDSFLLLDLRRRSRDSRSDAVDSRGGRPTAADGTDVFLGVTATRVPG